ncbi:hypothetical protein D3C81_2271310 [compost metagenome]
MTTQRAELAIQCTAPCGTVGSFLFTRNDDGTRDPVSPIYRDCAELFPAIAAAGWVAESVGLMTAYTREVAE